ncbi:HAD-IIIA family hydrolase [Thalassotalea euphylliae]|uniref:HAD-IIIA family hydrolase n=1 Tax=Thalassotalea euphylliae TaxID=1655234 RepID=A0A3E0TRT1_9GAMM|nr:HAD-IA family hydrolase [Thalassotalea euphylliae]REL27193.1 HAD-IIIA family hydrolase [Thalassotalea euphylliae]
MDNYKLYIFDWDGTLMDSIARIVTSIQVAAERLSLTPPSDDDAKSIIGLSLVPALQKLFPGIAQETVNDMVAAYKAEYSATNVASPLFEHVEAMLAMLKQQNKLVAVATGKARQGLNHMLDETQLHQHFDMTICADESVSKPAPDMIHQLLAKLNVKPQEAVMIGDSRHDLNMANNAGVASIGITVGADKREHLDACQPNAIVDSIVELKALVTGH